MYTNLQVLAYSTSSSDAQNIQTAPKLRKFLSGAAYLKAHLVDENGQPLHLANCNNIASSSHNPGTMMVIIIIIDWYIYWLICNYFNVKPIYNHAIFLQLAGWSGCPFSSTKCALRYAAPNKNFWRFGAIWIFYASELDAKFAWTCKFVYIINLIKLCVIDCMDKKHI